MKSLSPRGRHLARNVTRVGSAISLGMFVISSMIAIASTSSNVLAASNAKAVQILVPSGTPGAGQPLTSGGSATTFAMTPPVGAACSGDSSTGGYRVQTYMCPWRSNPAR